MALRQRIPFRLQDDAEDDDHVLDDQEQEELIEDLRKQSQVSTRYALILLQVVLGLSCLLHLFYLFNFPKSSPFSVLFPDAQHHTIPLASTFALIHILVHAHLSLNSLPEQCPMSDRLYALYRTGIPLPLPMSHPVPLFSVAVAPTIALLLQCGVAEVAWWSVAGMLTWLVWTVRRWISQSKEEIESLDGMRYDARGA